MQGSSTPYVYFKNSSWPLEQLLEPPGLPTISGSQLLGTLGFSVLQAHSAATVLDFILWSQFPLCCCFSCRTVETSLHPQSSCGFWGCLRATLGIALREGLGIGGVKGLPKSELRKGTRSTCSGGMGCMDIPIAA